MTRTTVGSTVMVMFTIVSTYQAALDVAELAKYRRQQLPTCEWELNQGQTFTCFLSHCKAEAGAEARFLKE
jgi:hypothetical protein